MLGNLFRPWCEQRDQLLVGGDQPPVSDSSTSSSSSSNSSSSSPSRITDNDNDGDMTGEDEAASGFSSHSSSMAAMMPDEEDEEEPIFEEDTAIGTSAGSCVDPPAEEGQGSPFEPGELTVSERAALEAQLLPYLVSSRFSDLRRLLEEAGLPAACYNALEHMQVAGSLKESSDQQRPSTEEAAACNEEEQEQNCAVTRRICRDDYAWWLQRCTACEEAAADKKEAAEPVQPPKRKKRSLSTSAPIRCRPPDLPESASAQEIAEAELCAQRPGGYRFLFGHYEHTVYDGGEHAYNFADESKAERAEVEYDARWVRKLALPEGTRLCFLRAAMGLGKSEAFVRLLLGIEGVNVDEFFSAQELQALSTLRRARDRVFRCLMIGPRVFFGVARPPSVHCSSNSVAAPGAFRISCKTRMVFCPKKASIASTQRLLRSTRANMVAFRWLSPPEHRPAVTLKSVDSLSSSTTRSNGLLPMSLCSDSYWYTTLFGSAQGLLPVRAGWLHALLARSW
eukprot:g68260.t1